MALAVTETTANTTNPAALPPERGVLGRLADAVTHSGPGYDLRPDTTELAQRVAELEAALERHEAGKKRWRDRAEDAEGKLAALAKVRVWRNEDGKGFLFADDVAAALDIREQAGTPEAEYQRLRARVAELEAERAAEPRATDGAVMQARRAIHAANPGPIPARTVRVGPGHTVTVPAWPDDEDTASPYDACGAAILPCLHCPGCDRCEDCGHCSGKGCVCECEENGDLEGGAS